MPKLNPSKSFIISPPFGSYLSHPNAYSVLGSYTLHPSPGRLLQIIKTVRPVEGGWLNKIGLRNPGMYHKAKWNTDTQIISLAAVHGSESEWQQICNYIISRIALLEKSSIIVEINISCPNTNHPVPMLPTEMQLKRLLLTFDSRLIVIFKLQPLMPSALDTALRLADHGAKYIHLSNTLPTPIGGISGQHLREANLPIVDTIANEVVPSYVDFEVIAGEGIYSLSHLRQYQAAGATRFSLATAFAKPWRGYKIIRQY